MALSNIFFKYLNIFLKLKSIMKSHSNWRNIFLSTMEKSLTAFYVERNDLKDVKWNCNFYVSARFKHTFYAEFKLPYYFKDYISRVCGYQLKHSFASPHLFFYIIIRNLIIYFIFFFLLQRIFFSFFKKWKIDKNFQVVNNTNHHTSHIVKDRSSERTFWIAFIKF